MKLREMWHALTLKPSFRVIDSRGNSRALMNVIEAAALYERTWLGEVVFDPQPSKKSERPNP